MAEKNLEQMNRLVQWKDEIYILESVNNMLNNPDISVCHSQNRING